MLGQHCIGLLSSQYCLNRSKTILHKKNTCAMLSLGRTDMLSQENKLYNIVLICQRQIAQLNKDAFEILVIHILPMYTLNLKLSTPLPPIQKPVR